MMWANFGLVFASEESVDDEGDRDYFCSKGCRRKFEKQPETYLDRIEA